MLHTKEAGTCRPLDAYTYLAQVIAKYSEDLKYNVNVSVNANRGYGVAYQGIAGCCIPRYCRVLHTKGTGTAPAWIPEDSSTDPLSSFNALLRLTLITVFKQQFKITLCNMS